MSMVGEYFNAKDRLYDRINDIGKVLFEHEETTGIGTFVLDNGRVDDIYFSGGYDRVIVHLSHAEPYEDYTDRETFVIPREFFEGELDQDKLLEHFQQLYEAREKRREIQQLTDDLAGIPVEILDKKYQRDISLYCEREKLAKEILGYD